MSKYYSQTQYLCTFSDAAGCVLKIQSSVSVHITSRWSAFVQITYYVK